MEEVARKTVEEDNMFAYLVSGIEELREQCVSALSSTSYIHEKIESLRKCTTNSQCLLSGENEELMNSAFVNYSMFLVSLGNFENSLAKLVDQLKQDPRFEGQRE